MDTRTHQLPISDVLDFAIEVFKDDKSDDALALTAAKLSAPSWRQRR